jgi:hypothetical protein
MAQHAMRVFEQREGSRKKSSVLCQRESATKAAHARQDCAPPTSTHQTSPGRTEKGVAAGCRAPSGFLLASKTHTLNQIIGAWGFHALHVGWHDSLERPAVLPCPRHCSVLSTGRVCSPVLVSKRVGSFSLCLLLFVESNLRRPKKSFANRQSRAVVSVIKLLSVCLSDR